MLIDLHVHVGDKGLNPAEVVQRARELRLDGVVLVDDDRFPDPATLPASDGVRVLAAAEVLTDRGHYLLFLPRPRELPPIAEILGPRSEKGWSVRDVLVRAEALGGAVVAAHPYDREIPNPGGDILYTLRRLTAVEAVNARRGFEIGAPAIEAADILGVACTGGSDAREALDEVGSAATLFARRIDDEEQLIDALKSGQCWPVEAGTPPFGGKRDNGGRDRERRRGRGGGRR